MDYNISQNGLQSVHFDVHRGGQAIVQNPTAGKSIGSQDLYTGTPDASGNPALQRGTHTLKLSPALNLTPDTSNEYIVVVATFTGKTSTSYFRKWMLGALAHGFDREALKAHTFPRLYTLGWLGGYGLDPWETAMADSLVRNDGYDYVIPFNWMLTSAVALPGLAQQAGANLATDVQTWAAATTLHHPGDVVDLHFIGHSRGTVVVTQALLKLAALRSSTLQGSYVDLTLLDPHPANNHYGLPDGSWGEARTIAGFALDAGFIAATVHFQNAAADPQVIVPAWVNHTDVWFQHTKAGDLVGEQYSEKHQNLWGMVDQGPGRTIVNSGVPISPKDITELTARRYPVDPNLPTSPNGNVGHAEVPYLYLQNVVDSGQLRAPQS